ncbi:Gfo/Idh/MocA family oxidoreductase [Ferrovibrio sp.]|uniref:Gfo/Idh/MocA family protein n=1 Tax=Ferrovibrio sp. TaxID=1917215 RepID=UPI00311DBBF8
MPLKTIRAGVVGLGVGEAHLRSYQSIPGCEVTAICDIDAARLAEIGDRYGVANRSTDYRAVTENPAIDVVSICSYDDAHAQQLISALDHGKHVMVEKPFVLHRREAEAVLTALRRAGTFITSNLILRHSPRFKAVKQMIEQGEFGDIFHIEGDYLHQILWKITEGWRGRMDFYCTVYGGGIHLLDLMRWLMGQEVTEVCAMGTDVLTRNSSYGRPDTITALLKWDGGATGKSTTTLGPQRTKFHSLNVFGTRKTFVNDIPDARIYTGDNPDADVHPMTVPYPAFEKGDLLPDFIDCIRRGEQPLVNETDIFRVMDVCFAIWEAVEQRRTITVDYLI